MLNPSPWWSTLNLSGFGTRLKIKFRFFFSKLRARSSGYGFRRDILCSNHEMANTADYVMNIFERSQTFLVLAWLSGC